MRLDSSAKKTSSTSHVQYDGSRLQINRNLVDGLNYELI